MKTKTQPLNPRIKISKGGRPYVETADLVESRLKRIGHGSIVPKRHRLEQEVIKAAKEWRFNDKGFIRIALRSTVDALLAFEAEHK